MSGHPSQRLLRSLILLIALLPLAATAASSGSQRGIHLSLELLSEDHALTPGGSHWLALHIDHDPDWHTYWRNPGDSGLPTRINWQLPEGFSAGPIQWPFPERLPFGPLTNFGYEGQAWLLSAIQVPEDAKAGSQVTLEAEIAYLVCKEECIPGRAQLAIRLPVTTPATSVSAHVASFSQARQRLPQIHADLTGSLSRTDDGLRVRLAGDLPGDFELFPIAEDIFTSAPFAGWQKVDGALVTHHATSDWFGGLPETAAMLLVDRTTDPARAYRFELATDGGAAGATLNGDAAASAAAPAGAASDLAATAANIDLAGRGSGTGAMSVWLALALALAGGVILNLMPCVFPVLSMKALALVQAGTDSRRARREGLLYTAGVLASFSVIGGLLLALRAGGQQVGWGFQLQSPWLVLALAYLMFLLGLALSGVVTLGSGWMNAGQKLAAGDGDRAAFFTGVLACVVAAPCTAPFMGAALGYALAQPAAIAMAVFLALGMGLALPLLLFALVPVLTRWLPRPGPWMETFKQALAFPLYLTAAWLLWVLALQTGAHGVGLALAGVVMVALAAWAWERARWGGAMVARIVAVIALALALALLPVPQRLAPALATVAADTAAPASLSQAWSAERLDRLRQAGEPVLVNMTAAWCITCLANERVALSSDSFGQRLQQHGIHYLKGDWTNHDEAISAYLAQFDRAGVPLYVLYPRGTGPARVLPQILTPGLVLAALDQAADNQ